MPGVVLPRILITGIFNCVALAVINQAAAQLASVMNSRRLISFGSFVARKQGPRMARNPKTGDAVPIPPRKVLISKPSQILRRRIDAQT